MTLKYDWFILQKEDRTLNKKRQSSLSQGLWDLLEPQCQFPEDLLKKLKQHFVEQDLGDLLEKVVPCHYITSQRGYINQNTNLTFICI
jgi:hypothetical protein